MTISPMQNSTIGVYQKLWNRIQETQPESICFRGECQARFHGWDHFARIGMAVTVDLMIQ